VLTEQFDLAIKEFMLASIVMSKKFRPIRLFFGVLGLTLQFFTFAEAQDITVTLSVDPKRTNELQVTGTFTKERPVNESHVLAFEESRAGVSIPASRIRSASAKDKAGDDLQLVTMPRCCIATGKIDRFSYTVDLKPSDDIRAEAHASWLQDGTGVLMLGDLLPQEFLPTGRRRSANVSLELPNGWTILSSDSEIGQREFTVTDIDNAVLFVGSDSQSEIVNIAGNRFALLTNGEFQFSQAELNEKVRLIVQEYEKRFGDLGGRSYGVALFKPRNAAAFGTWEADTRGRTSFIVTAGMAFKSQSLQQLDEQLRHELFHLWIPNGVALSGKYDWFYEGFALYSSLKLAVESNTIRFDDFLDTMSRSLSVQSEKKGAIGLIQLSNGRYSGYERQLYGKGLVFAFLSDLALNIASKGKRNTDTIVRQVYQQHKSIAASADGNDSVLKILNSYVELQPLVTQYVQAGERGDEKSFNNTASLLATAGLDISDANGRRKIAVRSKLSSRQKVILDKLGYNSWRKLVNDSK
jgi:hypothetical protein